MAYDNIYDM